MVDNELETLIRRLNETQPLNEAEARKLYRENTDRLIKLAISQADKITIAGDLADLTANETRHVSILMQPEDNFRAELRSIDNDLSRQVGILQEGFDIWFKIGAIVPPYYAWRVAIILAKAKRAEDEKAFLAAWCRHFNRPIGGRFSALIERARKRGVDV
jgi:hypothetical protein